MKFYTSFEMIAQTEEILLIIVGLIMKKFIYILHRIHIIIYT